MSNTSSLIRSIALAAAALGLATGSAAAQGKSGKAKGDKKQEPVVVVQQPQGRSGKAKGDKRQEPVVVVQQPQGAKIPPGLAKKPGQMPPGQYKKHYAVSQGATTLGDILRRNGYTVVRIVPQTTSQYVYYQLNNGPERRAVVVQGTDRLRFQNVSTSILQAVLDALYGS